MNKEERELPNPWRVGLLMGVLAFIVPYSFTLHPSYPFPDVFVGAVMWYLRVSPTGWDFDVLPLLSPWLYTMPMFWLYIGFRMLFPYQMMRYYQGKTTKKRTLALGVVTELPEIPLMILEAIISAIQGGRGGIFISLRFPLPLLLIVGMLLILFFPDPGKQDWDLERDTRKWWLKIAQAPSNTNESPNEF